MQTRLLHICRIHGLAAIPLMRHNKGGAIVNVAIVRSVVAGGGNLQYDTTKATVAGLTRGSLPTIRRKAFV